MLFSFSIFVFRIYFRCFNGNVQEKGNNMKIMDVNELVKFSHRILMANGMRPDGFVLFPRIVCEDGFEVSIQAGSSVYSIPRENGREKYAAFELGYPSEKDPILLPYAEDERNLLGTVYPFVPVEEVNEMIVNHGGIVDLKV